MLYFADPKVRRAIKELTIPLARNCLYQGKSPYAADDEFWTKLNEQHVHTGNSLFLCTASGQALKGNYFHDWYSAWKRLPEAERKPGAVHIEDRGTLDPKRARPQPPNGALIICVFARGLVRDGAGELAPAKQVVEGMKDFLWLTEREWRSLVPEHLEKGATHEVPDSISTRIARFHLVELILQLPRFWMPEDIRSKNLGLVVEDVSGQEVRMRLQGTIELAQKDKERGEINAHYQLLGYLNYDKNKKLFTRFDMVAVSDTGRWDKISKKSKPVGFAFELAGDSPADRIPPAGTWLGHKGPPYLLKGD